ncbi:hypothetical protein ASPZODRAFT_65601 [Penicilliopsis zonata CBS 506.65]|uniref:Uncharacterized protein n=1 Tax=Penicilliopsis zonata CBS 506.65 TaxID=1073090 RepID=A0A1L9SJB5_9EURO|nr:hypothetical protein ASPZODRAFT_65601 [Penicilliopsis zonata CBS 506.65]OJJ47322.1 hypothetical protein ASPZODRAFT_65601 [Penicilliopsis zonata CBS 506.65]
MLSLVDDIRKLAEMECSDLQSPTTHAQLLTMVNKLRLAIETPTETILRLIYQPPQNAALRTVVDLDIFKLVLEASSTKGGKGISATELAARTGAEKTLVVRLMRVMTALGLCTSLEPEVYLANDKTATMTKPIGRDGVSCIYDLTLPTLTQLPEYLREHGYADPKEYSRSPMQWVVGESQFEWLAQRKDHQTLFNSYMSSRREGKPNWFDIYPVERLTECANPHPEAVFLIDIGGNHGHDLQKLTHCRPDLPGRLILQDLPKVIALAPQLDGVEGMGYSFLDPQPVKGARAYFFRSIFHDWPDRICHKILTNTMSAMDPSYSRIIIMDHVLPDVDTPLLQAAMDIQMMSIGAGVERSELQWRSLLRSAGLKITGIWSGNPGMESVIEAVPMAESEDTF